jgi:hypothetical protein
MKLKIILHYIGLLVFFIANVLGGLWVGFPPLMMFPISLVLTFIVFYLIRLMINKKKETHTKTIETLSHWIIYLVIMGAGAIVSLHFITIQFIAKEDLRNNGNEKLESINKIRSIFLEVVNEHESIIFSDIKKKLNKYINSNRSDKKILEQELVNVYKINSIDFDRNLKDRIPSIASTSLENYYSNKIDVFFKYKIEKHLIDYYNKNKNVFNKTIFPIETNEVYYYLDDFLEKNKDSLNISFNKIVSNYGIEIDVFSNLKIPTSEVPLNNFTALRKQYPGSQYWFFYLLLQLLILSPLLFSRKEGKKPLSEEDTFTTTL